MVPRNRNPPWTELPPELLYDIANSLTSNPLDILVFRSFCRSWRSSFPRLPHISLLSPNLPLSIPFSHTYFYRGKHFLDVTVIYALYRSFAAELPEFKSLSRTSCILFLDEFTPGKVTIRLPFSSCSYSIRYRSIFRRVLI